MNCLNPKKMLIVDFCCAFFGGILYLLLFSFLSEKLLVPTWLIEFQLTANLLYGVYGLVICLKNKIFGSYLRFLLVMNGLYASFCGLVAIKLFTAELYTAAVILFLEALLIGSLVLVERKIWK